MDVQSCEVSWGVRLDVPLGECEACDRDLPRDIARLIVTRQSGGTPAREMVSLFAECMMRWRAGDEKIFVTPITAFLSDSGITALAERLGIDHVIAEPEHLFGVDEVAQLAGLLQDLKCEETAIFYAKSVAIALETLRAVVEFDGPYSCNNVPFVSRLAEHGGFLFYAESHASLEILGETAFVYSRCAAPLLSGVAR